MNESPLRFSLRRLFLATTLIATVIGAAANYPVVLIFSLCLVSPLLFVATMAYMRAHAPRVERSILLALCLTAMLAAALGLLGTMAFIAIMTHGN